jgi:hypothetical protein
MDFGGYVISNKIIYNKQSLSVSIKLQGYHISVKQPGGKDK